MRYHYIRDLCSILHALSIDQAIAIMRATWHTPEMHVFSIDQAMDVSALSIETAIV